MSTGTAPLSYVWQFGDGTVTDTTTNPVITADTCGIFQVVLVATDSDGLSDTDTQSIVIHCAPVAGFNLSDDIVCDSGDVTFTDTSIPADSIASWLWDFGDPLSGSANTSSLQNPQHHFIAQGLYTVSLTVTSQSGCSDNHTDTVIINDPVPFFTVNDSTPCAGDSVFFADATTSLDSVVGWAWNFDDPVSGNNAAATQNAAHVFSEPGDYFPRLTIQTQGGCTGFYKYKITVLALPLVDAGTDQTICPADSVQLTAGGATDYQWSPGIYVSDSSISNPFAFPPATISFFVTGTDINGCSNIDSVTVTVLPAPPANAGTDTSICAGTSATLHASGGISYLWSPNINISNDTIASPVVTPPSDITYNVTVTDEAGCTGVDSVTITVAPLPAVTITSFDSNYCANGSSVELTANPSGGLFSGDGVTGNLLNPSTLVIGGPYSIFYTYTDSIGCSGSDTASFTILNLPSVSIYVTDSSVCLNGTPVEIIKSPPGGILSGAGITDTVFDPTLLAAPGLYPVYYTVTDSAGCSNTDTINFLVLALPHINAGIDTAICEGDTIQLSGNGGISFLWSPDSSLSSSTDQNPLAFPDSSTMFLVTGTGINGCTATDSVLVTVISIASIDAGSNVAICFGDTAQLAASGGATYSWSPLDSLSDPLSDSTLAFPAATTTYTVSVNAGTSCPAIDSVTVTVNLLPVVVASQDSTFCFGDSVQLSASGAINFSWQPDSSLTDFQIANPIAFPGTTTLYIVEGSDINNCSGSDSVLLTVLPLPLIDAGADSAICLGDSIQLVASGGEVYVWQPASTLSNDTIGSPVAFPDSTTLYFLTGNGYFRMFEYRFCKSSCTYRLFH
jgi:PKD repeat protein